MSLSEGKTTFTEKLVKDKLDLKGVDIEEGHEITFLGQS